MKFKVGDVCEILRVCGCDMCVPWHGLECTVIQVVGPPNGAHFCFGRGALENCMIYRIDHQGRRVTVSEDELRLKRPPSWNSWIFDTAPVRGEKTDTEIVEQALRNFEQAFLEARRAAWED